jgi:hypothetical protein
LELQKPVDRRFKSDYPHALIIVVFVLFLLVFPAVPWAEASPGNQTSINQQSTAVSTSNTTGILTCLSKPGSPMVTNSTRVALIQPIFTATPYSQYITGSFYAFYQKYAKATTNITTDLDWLNTSVSSARKFNLYWGHSYPLYQFLQSKAARNCGLFMGKNLQVVSDINVTQGALFAQNGSANYDVAVVGFSEYVTQQEYSAFERFVASGGKLVIMGSDSFQVRVIYNPKNHYETYVVGHGFNFNNKTAWRSTPPTKLGYNLTGFIGGIDCCFRKGTYNGAKINQGSALGAKLAAVFGDTVFGQYTPHEEDSVRNFTNTEIIAVFRNSSGTLVATYVRHYGKGAVVCFCAFADDVIATDPSVQYFAMLAVGTPVSGLFAGAPGAQAPSALLVAAVAVVVVASVFGAFLILGRRRRN